jgi:hypothetical protein
MHGSMERGSDVTHNTFDTHIVSRSDSPSAQEARAVPQRERRFVVDTDT